MTNESENTEMVVEQLNSIARHRDSSPDSNDQASGHTIQKLGQSIHNSLTDRLDRLVAETTLTRLEAEAWALTEYRDEHRTGLTESAIALLFNTPNTGFGDTTDAAEDPTGNLFELTELERARANAERKVSEAQRTATIAISPQWHDALTDPLLAWLDRSTVGQLHDRRRNGESLDDVVTRLLDTETQRSLEQLVRGYLDARGAENVAQIAIDKDSIEIGTLLITAHTPVQDDLPDIVTETDTIVHRGRQYYLMFNEDPYGPHDHNRISLYKTGSDQNEPAVTLPEGLAAVEKYAEQVRDDQERDTPQMVE
jgi:hypothetical protein